MTSAVASNATPAWTGSVGTCVRCQTGACRRDEQRAKRTIHYSRWATVACGYDYSGQSGGRGGRASIHAPPLSIRDLERCAGRRGFNREEVALRLAGHVLEHTMDGRRHVGIEDADVKDDRLGARLDGLAGRQVVAQLEGIAEPRDRRIQGAQETLECRVVDASHDMEPEGVGLFGEDLGDVFPDALVYLGLARSPPRLELHSQGRFVMSVPIEREIRQRTLRLHGAAALRKAVGEPGRHLGGKRPRLCVGVSEQRGGPRPVKWCTKMTA